MKMRTILLVAAVLLCAGGATAQIDPGMHWAMVRIWGMDRNGSKRPSDLLAGVHAEAATEDVVIEHWVVRSPEEHGFRFGGNRLEAAPGKFASADDFLQHMWLQSVEYDEQWFYARQTVVYMPLARAVGRQWSNEPRPIACSAIVNDQGRVVGWQVRTEAWSMYTDHWVLYPTYRAPSQNGTVSFVDTTWLGCVAPQELIVREYDSARRSRNPDAYRYATATFALVPLRPTPSEEADGDRR